ncbi:hypothetical protein ACFQ6Q_04270 [Streptomyces sp. NPDC056437]|uniref:hypothetical protein n=1 Tax=Streptomyces sp. NPDC056437 TaxID=3345816 RepID=UPI0036780D55
MTVVLSRLLCDPAATPEVVVEDLGGQHIVRALRLVEPPVTDPDFVRSVSEHHTETDEEWALRVLGEA